MSGGRRSRCSPDRVGRPPRRTRRGHVLRGRARMLLDDGADLGVPFADVSGATRDAAGGAATPGTAAENPVDVWDGQADLAATPRMPPRGRRGRATRRWRSRSRTSAPTTRPGSPAASRQPATPSPRRRQADRRRDLHEPAVPPGRDARAGRGRDPGARRDAERRRGGRPRVRRARLPGPARARRAVEQVDAMGCAAGSADPTPPRRGGERSRCSGSMASPCRKLRP